MKRRRSNSFTQQCKYKISDDVFKIISKELDTVGNICEISEKFFEFLSKHEKLYAKEFDSNFKDYRDINPKGKEKFKNKKPNFLPIHKQS